MTGLLERQVNAYLEHGQWAVVPTRQDFGAVDLVYGTRNRVEVADTATGRTELVGISGASFNASIHELLYEDYRSRPGVQHPDENPLTVNWTNDWAYVNNEGQLYGWSLRDEEQAELWDLLYTDVGDPDDFRIA